MNRLKTAVYIAILAAYGCSPAENPSEKPIRRDLAEVVYASGNVYTETEYRIFSNVQGYLTEWMVSRSLDEIQELVYPSLFFRANRQTLVHAECIQKFEVDFMGKINVFLNLPDKKQIQVSKDKAAEFRRWMEERA